MSAPTFKLLPCRTASKILTYVTIITGGPHGPLRGNRFKLFHSICPASKHVALCLETATSISSPRAFPRGGGGRGGGERFPPENTPPRVNRKQTGGENAISPSSSPLLDFSNSHRLSRGGRFTRKRH